MQCGKQIRSVEQEYCYDCMHTHHYYERGLSLWNHKNPVNQSVYQFKYHNQRRYGILYSQELVKEFQKEIERWRPDIIMPVPLHPSRKRKRGYNQAQILAEEIGKILEIPVDSKSLIRTRKTSPQKKPIKSPPLRPRIKPKDDVTIIRRFGDMDAKESVSKNVVCNR